MTRTLVILTLNEIDGVRWLLANYPAVVHCADEVVAVDGGSTDGTREALARAGVRVLNQKSKGRGEAFRAAVESTTGDHIVFFSPDGNENPEDIPRLFAELDAGADVVIASRFLPESANEEDHEIFPARKLTNQAFTLAANLIWNRDTFVSDTINGFRGINRSVFKALDLRSAGYTIEYEMTIRAFKAGLRIVEIPTLEGGRVGGESKARSLDTGIQFSRFLAHEFWQTLTRSNLR